MDYKRLSTEVNSDPLARGYDAMSAAEVAADLNTAYREVIRSVLTGSTIFNAIAPSEFTALSDGQKQLVRDVFSLGDAVDVGPGTNARQVLLDAFGDGTTTRDNLIAAVTELRTRAEEIGFPRPTEADVRRVR